MRADNGVLWDRYKARGYGEEKVQENIDAEIMGAIAEENEECFGGVEGLVVELRGETEEEGKGNLERLVTWVGEWEKNAAKTSGEDEEEDEDEDEEEDEITTASTDTKAKPTQPPTTSTSTSQSHTPKRPLSPTSPSPANNSDPDTTFDRKAKSRSKSKSKSKSKSESQSQEQGASMSAVLDQVNAAAAQDGDEAETTSKTDTKQLKESVDGLRGLLG